MLKHGQTNKQRARLCDLISDKRTRMIQSPVLTNSEPAHDGRRVQALTQAKGMQQWLRLSEIYHQNALPKECSKLAKL
jgi:hypothetical protein